MYLFYDNYIHSGIHILPPDESKHCIRVLRLRKGDTVHLTDGKGNLFEARIASDNDTRCELKIEGVQPEYEKRNFNLHMAVAPTKNISRFEWFLEKATEVGIDSITPVLCLNSERRHVNHERLNKVIIAAMKQSLKAYLPVFNKPINFSEFVVQKSMGDRFIAYCSDEVRPELKNAVIPGRDTLIIIGPEGDFSKDEIIQAIQSGFKPVSLGNFRLRTETAALVACVTVNLINQ
ncbi:MAG: 16S rRNA (uracil(1498)-N(3))-methyltransferase [Bacteroidetes bacterium]|nr:16S rRNA (uracil(1498)-N(3))-methyltransferase [Bacteroidota bacterium]